MSKTNPADREAACLLDIQIFRKGSKNANLFTIVSMLFIVIVLSVLIWILPHNEFSEIENRYLQKAPTFEVSEIFDGNFTKKLSEYCKDSFPLRNIFVSLNSYTDLALGKREASGVIAGKEGVLIPSPSASFDSINNFSSNANAVNSLSKNLELPCTIAVIPSKYMIIAKDLPSLWSADRYGYDLPVSAVNLITNLTDKEYVIYNTDHHLTTYGAYLVYISLADELGYIPFADFTPALASSDFCGTSWSKSGLYLTSPDSLELYRYNGDNEFKVTGDVNMQGLYDFAKLSEKDKYAVFLGGNYGHIKISDNTNKPKLLIIKDSFANALAPFLARHFELDMVDPRYFRGDIFKIAKECDKVLFLYGAESWLSGTDLVKLTLK